jgi:hypothetical protein
LIPLRKAGCQEIFINGSFTTSKDDPGDIDCAWNPEGVDLDQLGQLEPVFFEFANGRQSQKDKFGCEFFPANLAADGAGTTFIEFFQTVKDTGEQKGIVCLSLNQFPGVAHHDDKE